ncbi:hypothetical protein B5S33_g3403 [[Candida] boidinii]|nr:hypothetical protein B5S30_g395 [[Candida] boidinii]OWB84751.1 hypothetical protein B5S33_g3403 [[Candida] boidinii]
MVVKGTATYKKKAGTLIINEEEMPAKLIWNCVDPNVKSLSVELNSIENLKATPPTSEKMFIKIILKIAEKPPPEQTQPPTSGTPGAGEGADGAISPTPLPTTLPPPSLSKKNELLFGFNSRDTMDEMKSYLQQSIARQRTTIDDNADGNISGQHDINSSNTRAILNESGAGNDEFLANLLDEKKLLKNTILQQKLLRDNSQLRKIFTNAVIKNGLEPEEFWSTRIYLLRSFAIQNNQKRGPYNVLSTIKPVASSENQVNVSVTREKIHEIFDQYPIVRKAYDDNVPRMSEGEFWSRFFSSKLFRKLRGEKINVHDRGDIKLDKYLKFDPDYDGNDSDEDDYENNNSSNINSLSQKTNLNDDQKKELEEQIAKINKEKEKQEKLLLNKDQKFKRRKRKLYKPEITSLDNTKKLGDETKKLNGEIDEEIKTHYDENGDLVDENGNRVKKMKYIDHNKINKFIDVIGNEDDNSTKLGNAPDITMKPDMNKNLISVLRTMNRLSRRMITNINDSKENTPENDYDDDDNDDDGEEKNEEDGETLDIIDGENLQDNFTGNEIRHKLSLQSKKDKIKEMELEFRDLEELKEVEYNELNYNTRLSNILSSLIPDNLLSEFLNNSSMNPTNEEFHKFMHDLKKSLIDSPIVLNSILKDNKKPIHDSNRDIASLIKNNLKQSNQSWRINKIDQLKNKKINKIDENDENANNNNDDPTKSVTPPPNSSSSPNGSSLTVAATIAEDDYKDDVDVESLGLPMSLIEELRLCHTTSVEFLRHFWIHFNSISETTISTNENFKTELIQLRKLYFSIDNCIKRCNSIIENSNKDFADYSDENNNEKKDLVNESKIILSPLLVSLNHALTTYKNAIIEKNSNSSTPVPTK